MHRIAIFDILKVHFSLNFYGKPIHNYLLYVTTPNPKLYTFFTKAYYFFSKDFFSNTVNNSDVYCTDPSELE